MHEANLIIPSAANFRNTRQSAFHQNAKLYIPAMFGSIRFEILISTVDMMDVRRKIIKQYTMYELKRDGGKYYG